MRLFSAVATVLFLSLIFFTSGYRHRRDDRSPDYWPIHENDHFSEETENQRFYASEICASENRSFVQLCDGSQSSPVDNLFHLQRTSCFCDDRCHDYHDCCFSKGTTSKPQSRNWICRDVRDRFDNRIPIYVVQECPNQGVTEEQRILCEEEVSTLQDKGLPYNHLQDIPVLSENTKIFYRNIYCAACNNDTQLVLWHSTFYCNGDSARKYKATSESDADFSVAVYNHREKNFSRVIVGGEFKKCRVVIDEFRLKTLVHTYEARLCKMSLIDTCPPDVDNGHRSLCGAYTSFVYQTSYTTSLRKVYKNFHCAICNKETPDNLGCVDPLYPRIQGTPESPSDRALSWLFDFNFGGDGGNQVGSRSPCKLSEGKLWDPVLKKCIDFICGALFKREGGRCVPIETNKNQTKEGVKSDCLKRVLNKEQFSILENSSIYVNYSKKILTSENYEVHQRDDIRIIEIAICVDEGSYLLSFSKIQFWLSEITLSISVICLILHLATYCILKELRNCPGKILMSLSTSLLCGHFLLLISYNFYKQFVLCYIIGVIMHFGYLCAFLWMSVMAFDIYRTFSSTQTRNVKHCKTFLRYSLYSWLSALFVVALSVTIDNFLDGNSEFRPKYGNPICWFNRRKGLIMFFVVPVLTLLLANITFFTITAFHIRKVSRQTKMVNKFTDKKRYFLYIKLSVVLGLTWLLGFFAGITQFSALWYPFIILNGLQGAFIFISFTLKKEVLKKLAVKFKIRSDSYKMGKQGFLRKAMYSSLSNLSNLQTTLVSHLPPMDVEPEMLKSVRKINPDLINVQH